jgi:hypothetical protein
VAVAPSGTAFTGPAIPTGVLIAAAAVFLLLGGTLLLWTKRSA